MIIFVLVVSSPWRIHKQSYGKKCQPWITQRLSWCNKICRRRTCLLFLAWGLSNIWSVSWCFCQALPSILFQLNDVIRFNCQKPTHKRDLKWLEWTRSAEKKSCSSHSCWFDWQQHCVFIQAAGDDARGGTTGRRVSLGRPFVYVNIMMKTEAA